MTKQKESVSKDLDKIKKEFEAARIEFDNGLDRLRKANERMVEQNNQSESEKLDVISEREVLRVKLSEVEKSLER